MNAQYLARFPALLALLAASTSMAGSQGNAGDTSWQSDQATVEGVWRVTRHGVNCVTGGEVSAFPALMTFHADGTVSGQAVPPGSTNAFGPAEHGVWNRKFGGGFSFKLLSYGYDDSGIFAGSVEVSGTGQLTNANSLTYKASVAFFDASGNLLFKVCGAATGLRFE
jgi:hypothetical protein